MAYNLSHVYEMCLSMSELMAISVCLDLHVFDVLPPACPGVDLEALAAQLERQFNLSLHVSWLALLLRPLVHSGLIGYDPQDKTYVHSYKSTSYRNGAATLFRVAFDELLVSGRSMPQWLREQHGRPRDLTGVFDGPLDQASRQQPATAEIDPRRERCGISSTCAELARLGAPLDLYEPVLRGMVFDPEVERMAFVDISGVHGEFLAQLLGRFEHLPSHKTVLQEDISEAEFRASATHLRADVSFKRHNPLHPQPVERAQVYHMRSVLPRFNDDTCVDVLRNVASVMDVGSLLLVTDMFLPENPVLGGLVAFTDWLMAMIGGRQRTRRQLEELLSRAGLGIVGTQMSTSYPWGMLAIATANAAPWVAVEVQAP